MDGCACGSEDRMIVWLYDCNILQSMYINMKIEQEWLHDMYEFKGFLYGYVVKIGWWVSRLNKIFVA